MALIQQPRTYCKIKGVAMLSEALFLNERRVDFVVSNGKDPFEVIYRKIKPTLNYILKSSYSLEP